MHTDAIGCTRMPTHTTYEVSAEKLRTHELLSQQPERKYITSNQSNGHWHIGRRHDSVGPKSGLILAVHYRTLCSGRTLGGAWGQTEQREHDGPICPRCARIAHELSLRGAGSSLADAIIAA